jgi:hypothetical protein
LIRPRRTLDDTNASTNGKLNSLNKCPISHIAPARTANSHPNRTEWVLLPAMSESSAPGAGRRSDNALRSSRLVTFDMVWILDHGLPHDHPRRHRAVGWLIHEAAYIATGAPIRKRVLPNGAPLPWWSPSDTMS